MRPLSGTDVCVQRTPGTKSLLAPLSVACPRGTGPTCHPLPDHQARRPPK